MDSFQSEFFNIATNNIHSIDYYSLKANERVQIIIKFYR